jgi:nicotinate-nucleotide adenylyltransferase
MKKPGLIFLLFWSFFTLAGPASFAQEFPNTAVQKFLNYEVSNDYKPDTTVAEAYRPGKNKIFKLQYIEIPASELNITDSQLGSSDVRQQILFEKDGIKYFRFFIHPDSESLYHPLIKRYGWAGYYWAAATSSTRSVIAWNPNGKEPSLYLKLSLAQTQDGIGRIIPDWEVRRSVGITKMVQQTPATQWEAHGTSIIPEYLGATVKSKYRLGFFIDEKQGEVFEHGLIAREAPFLAGDNQQEVMPLFSLFTKTDGQPPLIISYWQKSGEPDFYKFVEDFLFKPFLEKNAYLFFHQGIVPEIHGQNVLISLDRKTGKITHFYHRDVGSMNVDLRLRWVHGLSIEPLRSKNAAFDFKFARATEKFESVHLDYLNDWLFRWAYLNTLREYITTFSHTKMKLRLKALLLKEVRGLFPLRSKSFLETIEDHLKKFYEENSPLNWKPIDVPTNPEKISEFIKTQIEKGQFMELPETWTSNISFLEGNILFTEYGLVRLERNKSLRLYYYSSEKLKELTVPKSKAVALAPIRKRASIRKIGFFSGTFDPPHVGHLTLVKKAIKELQLDRIYIMPNVSPSHKPGASQNEERLQMAKLGFSGIPEAVVADPEQMNVLEKYGVGGFQRYLSNLHKDDLIFQIMGDDSYERLTSNPEIQFPKNFVIAVAARDPNFELLQTSYGKNRVVALSPDLSGISSTKIRNQISNGEKTDLLNPKVLNYVMSHGLYRQKLTCSQLFLSAAGF